MSDPVVPVAGRNDVRAAIQRAADATGVDFSLLIQTAKRESSLNANARASTSSAVGAFQFISSTWLDMVRRHGAAHGLGKYAAALQNGTADAQTRSDILALRTNPEIAARMAAELTRENATALESQIGRAPTAGELYAAHVLGSAGAAKLIQASANGADNAPALFPREAAANHGLFYTNGRAVSAQALLDKFSLDADANFSTPAGHAPVQLSDDMMSPMLAQALFNVSLLPLLNSGDDESRSDPLNALSAYVRTSQL
ncbi:MAG: lytic transglycosylase domain-containing protein [Terricaulis sp.]